MHAIFFFHWKDLYARETTCISMDLYSQKGEMLPQRKKTKLMIAAVISLLFQ